MIEKPLHTLIERFAAAPVLSDDRPQYNYIEYADGCSNSREFVCGSTRRYVAEGIHECTTSVQQHSLQNGHEPDGYGSEYVNRDESETSMENVSSTNGIDQSYCNERYRYSFVDFLPTDGQRVSSNPSSIHDCRGDQVNVKGVDSIPNGRAIGLLENTSISLQQSTETVREPRQCSDAENNCHRQFRADLSSDDNYKLVMEAIEQLENDNRSDQQPVNIQSTDITTTIDAQTETTAREHLEMASTHQTTRFENTQMDTSASQQPINQEESAHKETFVVPMPCTDVVKAKKDLTNRSGKTVIIYSYN